MYLTCFICKNKFLNLDPYISHLKFYHSLTTNSIYKCGIAHCSQTFSSFRSFSKHIRNEFKHTSIGPSSEVIYKNSLSNNTDTYLPNNLKDQITDVPNNILSTDPAIKNLNVDLNVLKKAVLQFSVQYYGKFNFSRKDATELQQNITKMITSSISKEINKIVIHNNTLDTETKNALKSIIYFCNDPFEGLDKEYKFLNTLQTSI